MAFWNRKKAEKREITFQDLLLQSGGFLVDDTITKQQAMNIPAVAYCVNIISDTIASLPIELYQETADGVVEEKKDDPRVALLNNETGDTLDSYQFRKALIEDFLMLGGGYAYINRQRNAVKSLHYVTNLQVGITSSPDPIFKSNKFMVYGAIYNDWEFIKLTRKTKNGAKGNGVLNENNQLLSMAYNSLMFEQMLVKTGGNKKGFLKSQGRLSPEAMNDLKTAFKNLYTNNAENSNIVVLNNGLEFQESNNNSVEMQVNQNKITNSQEIAKIFGVPFELMNGRATGGSEMVYEVFIKLAILPIIKAFETALNKDLLLQTEKDESFYFAFDTDELLKGDILKRYQAYDFAVKNGILQIDEIRAKENYPPLDLDFIKLNLADILYFPETKEIYTPNTNQTMVMGAETNEGEAVNQQQQKQTMPIVGNANKPNLEGGENKSENGNTSKPS